MAASTNQLTEALFQKSFADCSADEIRQLTAQYPYFAPAHLLLLRKLDPSTEAYRQQYSKSLLYFQDPFSFTALLHRDQAVAPAPVETAPVPEPQLSIAPAEAIEEQPIPEAAAEMTTVTADAPLPPMPALPDLNAAPVGDLSFEPLHAVDWFASQGIKLSQEEIPRDKFGKQLMSFTEWLKTMKRIPAGAPATQIDSRTEQKVESMADRSVKESDIVTESMAEVWLKQGNTRKAADIYRKLSLLHPAKSTYFADKINSLNK